MIELGRVQGSFWAEGLDGVSSVEKGCLHECGFSNFIRRRLIMSDTAAVLSATGERCVMPGKVFTQPGSSGSPLGRAEH